MQQQNGETLPGAAFVVETFIEVCWPWIILPAIVILASCALIPATALANRRHYDVLWKGSVLALTISRLDTTPEHEIANLRNVSQMHRISEETKVTIEQDEGPFVSGEANLICPPRGLTL